jgi:hypothetical protein
MFNSPNEFCDEENLNNNEDDKENSDVEGSGTILAEMP